MGSGLLGRRPTVRAEDYDYGNSGAYFSTVCSQGKHHLFGEVRSDHATELNGAGLIVEDEWLRTARMRKNIQLGQHMVMPDHIHGIILILREAASSRRPPAYGALPLGTIVRSCPKRCCD